MTMRVLVVSSKYPSEYSGSGLRAHRTYLRLKEKEGIEFDVLCSSVTENSNLCYTHEGVNVRRIACKLLPSASRQQWDQRTIIDKLALRINYWCEAVVTWVFLARHHRLYDAVHVFGNVAVTSAAITFCNVKRKPLIVELTYDASPQQFRPLLVKWLDSSPQGFHQTARFVCISARLEESLREAGMTHAFWQRGNPVDETKFFSERNKKDEFRRRCCSFAPTDKVLVHIAKFMPLKNQDFLVDVLRLLPNHYKMVLAGPLVRTGPNVDRDTQYLQQVRDRVADFGLQDRVEIMEGFIEDVAPFMKMADVTLLPSRQEALGTPMLESLCCGVPVVAVRMEGITDQWIKDGVNGGLSDLTPEEFARKIEQAVTIPLDQLDTSAREITERVSTRTIDEGYVRLLKDIQRSPNDQ